MKLENVKVGEVYTLKVGKNLVAVTVKGVDAKGKITVVGSSGKVGHEADIIKYPACRKVRPDRHEIPKEGALEIGPEFPL